MIRVAKRVILIGWDGADWNIISPLMDEGKMPNLEKLVNNGIMGNIASLEPMLSPMLWTSISTGKLPDRHQILGFAEPDGASYKIRPVTSSSRRCKALWNILSEQGLKCGVVNWFATYPAETINGFVVSDRFDFIHDRGKIPDAAVHPEKLRHDLLDLIMNVSDITPIQVLSFIHKPEEIDTRNDRNFQTLAGLLAQCSTVHNITTCLINNEEWDFLCAYYPSIDRFSHAFMEYRPPKMAHVSEKDFKHYSHVVEGCYRFHDMMLGRLLELAGEETTFIIVSDHGFHHDTLRPRDSSKISSNNPVSYHRKYGVLTITGPQIKKDARAYGASILDVAPTVLAMFGLPVPEDMDGNVLRQIFEGTHFNHNVIDTYEKKEASKAPDDTSEAEDPWARQEMLGSLEALGYIDLSGSDREIFERITTDRIFNLSIVYTSTNRPELAVKELEKLPPKHQEEAECRFLRVINFIKIAKYNRAEEILNKVMSKRKNDPQINYQMGLLRYYQRRNQDALTYLRKAETYDPENPYLYVQIGQVYLSLDRWDDAEKAFLKALVMDEENAPAYDGIGIVYQKLGDNEKAVDAHMRSVALLHYQPMAHYHLGVALAKTGQINWAIRALRIASEQAPDNPAPKRLLAELIAKREEI